MNEPLSAPPRRTEASLDADDQGLTAPLADLRSVLIPEETLEAWAVQRRVFALTRRRLLIAATSGRLIWITRKLLGGFDVSNIRWQDLEDVTLRVGMLGADLLVRAGRAADLASEGAAGSRLYEFPGLRKAQAQAVYRICQAQDQAWREKRRVRELEELRARSGGFQMPGGGLTGAAGGSAAIPEAARSAGLDSDAVRRLQEAKKMLDERLITDSEYEAIKARILS
ncbi:MAG TPA: hypothetical protein VMU40_06875 [Steroidobacteraceae bacterium]|nr:hypothetical protein [Steroidobacteraceae bacterium]